MVGENAHITAPQSGAGHHIFAPAAKAHVVSLSPSPTGIDAHVARKRGCDERMEPLSRPLGQTSLIKA